jgi:hypothetical protein
MVFTEIFTHTAAEATLFCKQGKTRSRKMAGAAGLEPANERVNERERGRPEIGSIAGRKGPAIVPPSLFAA